MKLVDADVIWVPINKSNMDAPNSGSVPVEKHRSGWQRTKGDRWMPAKSLGVMGEINTSKSRDKRLLAMFILFNTLRGTGRDCRRGRPQGIPGHG